MNPGTSEFHEAVMAHQPATVEEAEALIQLVTENGEEEESLLGSASRALQANGLPEPESYNTKESRVTSEEDADLKYILILGMCLQAKKSGNISEDEVDMYALFLAMAFMNAMITAMGRYPHTVSFSPQ